MKRPPGGRSHWEGGPQQPRCARTLQGILQFISLNKVNLGEQKRLRVWMCGCVYKTHYH